MSDINQNTERESLNSKKLKEFRKFCASVCVCYELLLDLVEESMDLATMESATIYPHTDVCNISGEAEVIIDSDEKDVSYPTSATSMSNDDTTQTRGRIITADNKEPSIIDISTNRMSGQFIADPGSAFTPAIDLLLNRECIELERGEVTSEKMSDVEGKYSMSGKDKVVTFYESHKSSKSDAKNDTHNEVPISDSNIEDDGKDGDGSLVLSVSLPPSSLGTKVQRTELGPELGSDSMERTPSPLSPESCFTLADNVM